MSGNKMKGRLEMSEIGVAASEEVVLSVVTHLKNGKIEDALAGFAEEFRFKDHGIGLDWSLRKRALGEILPQDTGALPRFFAADGHNFREWRCRDHRMDTSSYVDRAFLRRTHTKGSSHGTRGLHRADRQREDYRLGGLLRRTDLTAHSPGCAFHGMGRTLNGGACRRAA